ncbi:MAG: hypothetical protein EBR82_37910 [Caulobacteraceae bacterium]|nr:hypothetical protein [Caulobacteraceae bacterium]
MREELQALARDLEKCDLGLAMTKGKLRKRYAAHRAACMARINELDPVTPGSMTDEELLRELQA